MSRPLPSPRAASTDRSLSVLLAVQALTLFVAIPFGTIYPAAHILLDLCHLVFAMVCITVLTRNRPVQAALLAALLLVGMGPVIAGHLLEPLGFRSSAREEMIAFTAFLFNAAVTLLVARHVFGPGRVTVHRVQGAVLRYLNVAALFAIAYAGLAAHVADALVSTTGAALPSDPGARTAALTYFSLTTITTTGFGDLVPAHPIIRSLANLESVFGQLFPATLLARIVALHLAHENGAPAAPPPPPPEG